MMSSALDLKNLDFLRGLTSVAVSSQRSELSLKTGVSSGGGGGAKGRASDRGGCSRSFRMEKQLDAV